MQRGRAELTLRGARRCSRAGDRELRLAAAERGLGSCSGARRAFLMYVRISLLWCLLYFLLTSDSRAGLLRAFICGLSTTLAWLRCSCIGIAPGAKPNAEARPSSVRRRTRMAVQELSLQAQLGGAQKNQGTKILKAWPACTFRCPFGLWRRHV